MDNLKSNTNTILNNLEVVRKKGEIIYKNDQLQNKYNNINSNNERKINRYQRNKVSSEDSKVNVLNDLLDKKRFVQEINLDDLKSGRYDLDKNFIENVDKNQELNKEIMTKDKIIMLNEYYQGKKDMWINVLKDIILFLVLMIVPLYLIGGGYISTRIGLGFIGFCALITLTVVMWKSLMSPTGALRKIEKETVKTLKDFSKDIIKDIFSEKYLKKDCKKVKEGKKPELPDYDYQEGNEVSLDNSQDVFSKGDIPSIGATEKGYKKLGDDAEPKPFYKGDKLTKTYTCRWNGDPNKMTNMDKGLTFDSTIPCEYFPGYVSISKS